MKQGTWESPNSSRFYATTPSGMSRPTPPAYKTLNWPAYNEALKRRGSLTIWFDPDMIWEAAPTGKRGRRPDYSGEKDQKTVRGAVFPTNAQAWRHETPCLAQDPYRN